LAAHLEEFLDGLPEMSNCYCLPGKAGGTPGTLGFTLPASERFLAACSLLARQVIAMHAPC